MQTYRVEGGKLAQTWLILEPLGPHGPTPRRRSVDQSSTSERALNHCPPRKVHTMPLGPGSRLHAYEIVRPLGAGGMGEVWLATELRLGRKVALKLLPADLTQDPVRVQPFEQEARVSTGSFGLPRQSRVCRAAATTSPFCELLFRVLPRTELQPIFEHPLQESGGAAVV